MMAADRSWIFGNGNTRETEIRRLCQQVEEEFDLPNRRLCRYFADFDDEELLRLHGRHFRGFHAPISAYRGLDRWPYLKLCFLYPLENFTEVVPFEQMVAFDSLIYIRSNVWSDTKWLLETYAHELQHVVQHAKTPRLCAVNSALYWNLKTIEPTATAIDIPTETEANIVSKRICEKLYGVEAVKAFAEEQIRLMEQAGAQEEKERWEFFRDVPSSTPFNLLEATLPLVEKYKGRLDFRINVDADEWWVGPLKDEDGTSEVA
jgi:hypothetical protein